MTEVRFYHLEHKTLMDVLPRFLLTTIERGQRAVVEVGSEERVEALAADLWTFSEEVFLPHGTKADGSPDLQPVWLTCSNDNPNGSTVRFFVDGATPGSVAGLDRAIVIFDGADEIALAQAREDWKRLSREGLDISYWQQDEQGRWVNRAQRKPG
jgi:DNA polymerase-3 subunit chi